MRLYDRIAREAGTGFPVQCRRGETINRTIFSPIRAYRVNRMRRAENRAFSQTNSFAPEPEEGPSRIEACERVRVVISLRRDDRVRRFAALFQYSHVCRGKVWHPTVF